MNLDWKIFRIWSCDEVGEDGRAPHRNQGRPLWNPEEHLTMTHHTHALDFACDHLPLAADMLTSHHRERSAEPFSSLRIKLRLG